MKPTASEIPHAISPSIPVHQVLTLEPKIQRGNRPGIPGHRVLNLEPEIPR